MVENLYKLLIIWSWEFPLLKMSSIKLITRYIISICKYNSPDKRNVKHFLNFFA